MGTAKQGSIEELVEQSFKNGNMLISLNQYPRDGEEVTLDFKRELLPYACDTVHLLSPHPLHERTLLFSYIQELISMVQVAKEEGLIEDRVLMIVQSLLLALDYLSHHQFNEKVFTEEHRSHVCRILQDCFKKEKTHSFSTDANRTIIQKSTIKQNKDKIYCMGDKEAKTRLYLAVVYQKPTSAMEHFKQVGHWLGKVHLNPNASKISYEDSLKGMTDHELHMNTPATYAFSVEVGVSCVSNKLTERLTQGELTR